MEKPLLCSNILYCHNNTRFTCTRCKAARYCSESCQKQHYDIHKPYCLATAEKLQRYTSKVVSRCVALDDRTYNEALKAQQNGQEYQIAGRDGMVTCVVLRKDGILYESPSGLRVEKISIVKQGMKDIETLTTWGKLHLSCKLITSEYGYSILYDEQKKEMYLYHSKSDRIVEKIHNVINVDAVMTILKQRLYELYFATN